MSSRLPTRTVTFLFTDTAGSTRLWDAFPTQMRVAAASHDAIIRRAVAGNRGAIVKQTGDGMHAVFADASDGVRAAREIWQELRRHEWGEIGSLTSRMALHSGVTELRDGDYYGSAGNRAARLPRVVVHWLRRGSQLEPNALLQQRTHGR